MRRGLPSARRQKKGWRGWRTPKAHRPGGVQRWTRTGRQRVRKREERDRQRRQGRRRTNGGAWRKRQGGRAKRQGGRTKRQGGRRRGRRRGRRGTKGEREGGAQRGARGRGTHHHRARKVPQGKETARPMKPNPGPYQPSPCCARRRRAESAETPRQPQPSRAPSNKCRGCGPCADAPPASRGAHLLLLAQLEAACPGALQSRSQLTTFCLRGKET